MNNFHNEAVKIDVAHAALLHGLVRAHKPERVLEFGFGGGRSLDAILEALTINRNCREYVLVDNWADFGGVMPGEARRYVGAVDVTTNEEKDFVAEAIAAGKQFDFIMSDADHYYSNEWAAEVFLYLLTRPGIIVYHDIQKDGPFWNLYSIKQWCENNCIPHMLFNRSSLPGERCERGLLVIFKGVNTEYAEDPPEEE